MGLDLEKFGRKLKRAFPRHVVYLSGYPTAHGGVNIIYHLAGDEVVTYGLDDYGALVFELLSVDEYCENYRETAGYTIDLIRSVSTRSPEPMKRWGIPPEAWRRAWRKGDMYDLYWDYVVEREKQQTPGQEWPQED